MDECLALGRFKIPVSSPSVVILYCGREEGHEGLHWDPKERLHWDKDRLPKYTMRKVTRSSFGETYSYWEIRNVLAGQAFRAYTGKAALKALDRVVTGGGPVIV